MKKPETLHPKEYWCYEDRASQFGDLITAIDVETAVEKCAELWFSDVGDEKLEHIVFVETHRGVILKFKVTTEFEPVFHVEGIE